MCELESAAFLDSEADEFGRAERSFVRVKGKQLDPAAVVQRRDDARRLLEYAVWQRAWPVRNFRRHDLRRGWLE